MIFWNEHEHYNYLQLILNYLQNIIKCKRLAKAWLELRGEILNLIKIIIHRDMFCWNAQIEFRNIISDRLIDGGRNPGKGHRLINFT